MKIYNLECKDKGLQTWMLLKQTAILCDQLAEQTLLDTGVTAETLTVLSILDKAKGSVIPAELARYTSRTNQTLAGLINRLERDDLAQRIKKAKGHPYTEVVITPKGKQLVKKASKVYDKLIADMEGAIAPSAHAALQVSLGQIRDEAASRLHLKVINKKY